MIELYKHRGNIPPDTQELKKWFRKAAQTVQLLVEDMVLPAHYSNSWFKHSKPHCTMNDVMKLLYRLRQQYLARNHAIRMFEIVRESKLFNGTLVHSLLKDQEPDAKTKALYEEVVKHLMSLVGKALHLVSIFQKHEVYPGKIVFNDASLKGQLKRWFAILSGYLHMLETKQALVSDAQVERDDLAKEQLASYEDWYNNYTQRLEKPEPAELLKFFKQKVSKVKEALDSIPKSSRRLNTSEKRVHRPISPIKLDESSVDGDEADEAIRRNPPSLISP